MQNKRTILYWSLQLVCWGIYFSVCATFMLLANPKVAKFSLLLAWVSILAGHLAVSHFLRYVIKRRRWFDSSLGLLAAKLLAACIVSAFAVNILVAPIPTLLGLNSFTERLRMFRYFVPYSFFLFAIWSLIYVAVQYFLRFRTSEIHRLRLQASINEAELRALKAQVNPHFLFNCLNNLRALIAEDADRARQMLLHLSELLRYSLEASRSDKVTLAEELRIVEGYLALEKLQFEDRLTWRFDLADSARPIMIPPMLVQQLVENAIKHGIAQDKAGGEILIRARYAKSALELRVENTGSLKPSTSKGFGIENARERLRLLCGSAASFDLQNVSEGRVAATAHIPLPA
jgi:two-component system LytT family sensor kinase